MAEISRRAGVGMATLYRNFPGRRELLEALYAERSTPFARPPRRSTARRLAPCSWPGCTGSSPSSTTKRPIAAELLDALRRQQPRIRRRPRPGARRRPAAPRRRTAHPARSAKTSRSNRSSTWSSPSPRSTAVPATSSRFSRPRSTVFVSRTTPRPPGPSGAEVQAPALAPDERLSRHTRT